MKDQHDQAVKQKQTDIYKTTLEQQMSLKDEGRNNYGKMTFQEKRLNRVDLDNFKEHQPATNAMVPGINHLYSIGSRPLKYGGMNQVYYGKKANEPLEHEKGHIFAHPTNHYSYSSLPGLGDNISMHDINKVQTSSQLINKEAFNKAKQS